MIRIPPVDDTIADADTVELLGLARRKMGCLPNFITTMANSPAVLRAYFSFARSLSEGSLSSRLREKIALFVSETSNSGYCVAAHTVLGMGAGLTRQETCDARRGISGCRKEQLALEFAGRLVQSRGKVTGPDVGELRQAGYTDGEISEIVANVVLTLFTNYFNLVAGTEMDFPAAPRLTST